jgi:hypothetical protein
MNILELKNNNNYEILKEDNISFSLEVLDLNILYKTIVTVSIFEKYILQVIDKAFKYNISLLNTMRNENIVNFEKISQILLLDVEIIENTIDSLSRAGLIAIENKILMVKWNSYLKNWEKEVLEEEQKRLFFKNEEAINSFHNLAIDDKEYFLFNKYSSDKKTFYHFEINQQEEKEIILKSFILLDNDSFEIKIVFEKDNELLTLSDTISDVGNIQKIFNEELIIIDKNEIKG